MSLFDCFTAGGLAGIVFLIILVASLYAGYGKAKPYRKPDSESEKGLKPDQIFSNSKVVEEVDMMEELKKYRRAGQ
jgi:hypothetical protein